MSRSPKTPSLACSFDDASKTTGSGDVAKETLYNVYKTVVKKRTPTRAKFTRLYNEARSIMDNASLGAAKQDESLKWYVNELNDTFMKLKTLDTQLEEIIVEIGNTDEIDEFYREKDERSERDSKRLHELKLFIETQTQQSSMVERGFNLLSENISQMVKTQEQTMKSFERGMVGVKLPEISLPKFDGNPLKWTEFWDLYRSTIHDNIKISNAQKLAYLRSQLQGRALEAIEGFKQVEINYNIIVETLMKKFGRPKLIAKEHTKTLLNSPRITDSSDVSTLRKQLDLWEANIRSLKEMNLNPMDSSIGNLTYLTVFEEKLPPEMLRRWEIKTLNKEDDATLEAFFSFVSTEVEANESKLKAESSSFKARKPRQEWKGRFSHRSFSRPMYEHAQSPTSTMTSNLGQVEGIQCAFCNHSHSVEQCCKELLQMNSKELLSKVYEKKLCLKCFSKKQHLARECNVKVICLVCKKSDHHTLLHEALNKNTPKVTTPQSNTATETTNKVLLQSAIAKLELPNGEQMEVRVLLDSGSNRSFVKKSLIETFGIQATVKENLSVKTLGGETITSQWRECVNLELRPAFNGLPRKSVKIQAIALPKVCEKVDDFQVDVKQFRHLRKLDLADRYPRNSKEVDILIGMDYYHQVMKSRTVRGKKREPVATLSAFGWILSGPTPMHEDETLIVKSNHATVVSNAELNETMKKFWEMESTGIQDVKTKRYTAEEEFAIKHFEDSVRFKDGRYEVTLPKSENFPPAKTNYVQCKARLEQIERKYNNRRKDKQLDYQEAISKYQTDGIAEEVKDGNNTAITRRYLPHHAVVKEDRITTKTRIVFDASAKDEDELSLNDCVLPGPALQPDLISVLLRFRSNRIALIADIKKMFLQVKLGDEDKDLHRYLWRDFDVHAPMRIFRMTRLTFGVSSSPFLAISVTRKLAEDFQDKYPEAAEEIKSNMYVDDYLGGAQDAESAIKTHVQLKSLMKEGGFELSKWASNSTEVLNVIPDEDKVPIKDEDLKSEPLKALGIAWSPQEDTLRFIVNNKINLNEVQTKRTLLGAISKVFDPLGLVSPFILTAKLIVQELWTQGVSWDDQLNEEYLRRWKQWHEQLTALEQVKISRCFLPKDRTVRSIEVHGFADASERAYSGVIYLRIETEDSKVQSSLVMSKTKVAPLKKLSLPRLELMAALITARLARYVITALQLQVARVCLWTDSMIVLHWIRGYASEWKTFVSNRVQEIQEISEPECWRHCPGNENPADVASRGSNVEDLHERWWSGPSFLEQPPSYWPVPPQNQKTTDDNLERKKCKEQKISTNVAQVQTREPLFDVSKFEKWSKILTVTARVMKCFSIWKSKTLQKNEQLQSSSTSSTDIKKAELYWLKEIQHECYSDEFHDLKQQRRVTNKSTLLPLCPVLDEEDGLLKVGGRLKNAELLEEQRQPIILPKKHDLVHKIIQSLHEKQLHAGTEHVLAHTRESGFWIVHGRREVKKVIDKCVVCKRWNATAAGQKMGQLPKERVVPEPSFTNVGMDFAGPFYVKEGKTKVKSYVCLFVCMSSRAVHLELVLSMDTERVLMALRRLFARRGLCKTIWSDNFKSFKSANKQLQTLWKRIDEKQVLHELNKLRVEWKFIPERAPHMGGFYERMVKSIKIPLKKVLGKAFVNAEQFITILTEVEGQINSRTLTQVSSDPSDLNVITPAHLMIGRPLHTLPNPPKDADVTIAKRWRQRQRLSTHFWNRWRKEYLTELNRYKKWMKAQENLRVGDIVLVSENRVPRGEWPLGRIIKTYPGEDALVRVVQVKTSKGEFKRPVHKLYLLEGKYTNNT